LGREVAPLVGFFLFFVLPVFTVAADPIPYFRDPLVPAAAIERAAERRGGCCGFPLDQPVLAAAVREHGPSRLRWDVNTALLACFGAERA